MPTKINTIKESKMGGWRQAVAQTKRLIGVKLQLISLVQTIDNTTEKKYCLHITKQPTIES